MIELEKLSVVYKADGIEFPALDNINLHMDKGDIFAVIGPSGCGKSTLLHVLAGLIRNYGGSVLIDGKPVNPRLQQIGFIPQNAGLLEWADVYANSTLGLHIKGRKLSVHKGYIDYILGKLGISDIRTKYPGQLSGGQRQRVSIARSFILKPDILLMDEPFSALDAITREETQELFLSIWKENAVSTVFVTHSIEEAAYMGRKIAIMSPCPGHIVKVLENPFFSMENLRFNTHFYEFCMELRRILKKEWSECS